MLTKEKDGAVRYEVGDISLLGANNSHSIILELLDGAGEVLELGCATGDLGRALARRGVRVSGVEMDPAAAELARSDYREVVAGDVADPAVLAHFRDGAFDAVVFGDVLEHLADPWAAAKAWTKKLAPGGNLIISIPNLGHASVAASLLSGSFAYQDMGLLDRTHLRFFSLEGLLRLALDSGLTPVELRRVSHGLFETEVTFEPSRLPEGTLERLSECPEARTYQFVLKARREPAREPLSAYLERFAPAAAAPAAGFAAELELRKRELRETRESLAAAVAEKDSLRLWNAAAVAEKDSLRARVDLWNADAEADRRLGLIAAELSGRGPGDEPPPPCRRIYDIVIPVYNAFEHLERCLASVLAHTPTRHPVYLLDDASTDPRVLPFLKSAAERNPHVRVVEAERNAGFVANANKGMALTRHEVVLLNSDTEVTSGWLERMERCLESDPAIGIVSPLSNKATILSVPVFNKDNELPEGMTPEAAAALVARHSRRTYPRLPVAVGFCMLITRKTLKKVGLFDAGFGRGYGEESDFCRRAWAEGIEVAACDDAYVHHYGKASFGGGEADAGREANQRRLERLWPDYQRVVFDHCRRNPLRPMQERLGRALAPAAEARPHVLQVIHKFGTAGGTELSTLNLIGALSDDWHFSVLFPDLVQDWTDLSQRQLTGALRAVRMNSANLGGGDRCGLFNDDSEGVFARFLDGSDFGLVHFQHLLGFDTLMLPLIAKAMGRRVVITAHDYFLLCPEFNMLTPELRRCGKNRADPFSKDCAACLQSKRKEGAPEAAAVAEYLGVRQRLIRRVLAAADAVVAPSDFVRAALGRAYGADVEKKVRVFAHGMDLPSPAPRRPGNGTLRVGFLGNMTPQKGAKVVLGAARLLRGERVSFTVFGGIDPALQEEVLAAGFSAAGEYKPEDLPGLLAGVDLVVVPSVWDETYCLTVTEAQGLGVPVVASAAGAITERVRDGVDGYLVPPGDAAALAERLRALAKDPAPLEAMRARLSGRATKSLAENAAEYAGLYRELLGAAGRKQAAALIPSVSRAEALPAPAGPEKKNPPGRFCIKEGYASRGAALYFPDTAGREQGVVHQPEVYPFAAFLARRLGCDTILEIGCGTGGKLAALHPEFKLIGVDHGTNLEECRARYPFGRWLGWDLEKNGAHLIDSETLKRSVIVCSDVIEHLADPSGLLGTLKTWLDTAGAVVLTTPERDLVRGAADLGPPANPHHVREWNLGELEQLLLRAGLKVSFIGLTMDNTQDQGKKTIMAVLENNRAPERLPAPPGFRVLAVMTAYNEADVIRQTLSHLIAQGAEVHLVDNWSDDGTYEIAREFLGRGLAGLERFPAGGPAPHYDWAGLLRRVEEVAAGTAADWVIHHDSDELRHSPWPGVSLKDALYHVERSGFNAVDHTVLEFPPVDESFAAGGDLGAAFPGFEFAREPAHFVQIKAWKTGAGPVSLAPSGGHDAQFRGRRVYPYKFLTRHYPVRSQAHGEKKVFLWRKARFSPEERARGWHSHYDHIEKGHSFLRDAARLQAFVPELFARDYLVERLSGVGAARGGAA
jgi:GT2 family glycosyltransferase/glycosyltransferase involved in cell wall biosynthesis/2-polyprenyl-3-methyl-5-hydroxy-6-metoxy-1,4-benzoquinol methylase